VSAKREMRAGMVGARLDADTKHGTAAKAGQNEAAGAHRVE